MIEEYKETVRTKSKILKKDKEKYLDELELGLEKIINKK